MPSSRELYDHLVDEQARNYGPERLLLRKIMIIVDAKRSGEQFEKDVEARRETIEKE